MERTVLQRHSGVEGNPVAWRVKDFADGWILFNDEYLAECYAIDHGALLQGLYLREINEK